MCVCVCVCACACAGLLVCVCVLGGTQPSTNRRDSAACSCTSMPSVFLHSLSGHISLGNANQAPCLAFSACRVVAWEPVTTFRAFFEYSIVRNKLQHKVEVRPSVVVQHPSSAGEQNYTVVAPQRGIWGTASIKGQNIDPSIDNKGAYHKVTSLADWAVDRPACGLDALKQRPHYRNGNRQLLESEPHQTSCLLGCLPAVYAVLTLSSLVTS